MFYQYNPGWLCLRQNIINLFWLLMNWDIDNFCKNITSLRESKYFILRLHCLCILLIIFFYNFDLVSNVQVKSGFPLRFILKYVIMVQDSFNVKGALFCTNPSSSI